VVEVGRRTALRQAQGVLSSPKDETDDAPGSQGAKRENIGKYSRVEQRSEAGCCVGRMQTDVHHGLLSHASSRL